MSVDPIRRSAVPRLLLCVLMAAQFAMGLVPLTAHAEIATDPPVRLIVELDSTWATQSAGSDVLQEASAAVVDAVPGAVVERTYERVLSGLSVRIPDDDAVALECIAGLDHVRRVYREQAYALALFDSVSTINVGTVWQSISGGAAEAGRGVRIAVIDSGIAAEHPSLDDAGYPTELPAGFPRGDTNCTSNKVIAARAYFRPTDPPCSSEASPTPGENGSPHGTAMAGIAAGSVGQATYDGISFPDMSGVAPGAYLMNYRVFYPTEAGADEYAYTTEILSAIEDAIDDGADIILNCWTSVATVAPYESAVALALDQAIDQGIVVVAPVGNEGPGEGSASLLPGGLESVLTVGAVRKSQIVSADTLDVTGPEPVDAALTGIPFGRANYGTDAETLAADMPVSAVPSDSGDTAGMACASITSATFTDTVAVALRGECAFLTKTLNVQDIGASGLIVVNEDVAHDDIGCYGDLCDEATIPSVMIGQYDGLDLLDRLAAQPSTMISFVPETRIVRDRIGLVCPESGRGPAYMSVIKPDLVAPGVNVLAPIYPSSTGESLGLVSGSSAAAAHMAGAAALLIDLHPTWGHEEIKSALMGSSRTDSLETDNVNVVGAGLPDVALAASSPLTCEPASLHAAVLPAEGSVSLSATLYDTVGGSGSTTYSISSSSTDGIRVEHAASVAVAPAGTSRLEIDVIALPDAASGSQQATISLTHGDTRIDVPLWAYIQPEPAEADVLVIDNDFSEFEGYPNHTQYVTETLEALDVSYQTLNPDLIYGESNSITMSLGNMLAYDVAIWVTGDHQFADGYYQLDTPLTVADQQLLAAYLDGGGRLLAMGQNLCAASDVNEDPDETWGRAPLYHGYLGAHWVQDELFGTDQHPPSSGPAVIGAPNTFLSGVQLHLGETGDGAGNQISVDEVAPGGSRDGKDADLCHSVLVAVDGSPSENGYVGVAKAQEPGLDDATVEVPYRTLYYSFGFEGVNTVEEMTTRAELLDVSLDWLLDEVTISMEPVTSSVNVLTELNCSAVSTHAEGAMSYLWRVGEGEDAWETVSDESTISVMFYQTGTMPVVVEVTDSLGHQAVTSSFCNIVEGGQCSLIADMTQARPGETIAYTIEVRNTAVYAVEAAFALELPASTSYVDSMGGTWANGALSWSGTLGPESVQTLEMVVDIDSDVALGTAIVAVGAFTVGGHEFELSATTQVSTATIMLPLVIKD